MLYFPFSAQIVIDYNCLIIILDQMHSAHHESLQLLKSVHHTLQQKCDLNQDKIIVQKKIFDEFFATCYHFCKKMNTLSNTINEEILTNNSNEELIVQNYQFFSNALLRLVQCTKNISSKFKTQIIEPFKTFSENFENVGSDLLKKINSKIVCAQNQEQQLLKCRQNYNTACQKLQKNKQIHQKKHMEKIESGDAQLLERFNQNMKKMTESITSSEKHYRAAVENYNVDWYSIKQQLKQFYQSIAYNQETRLTFFKKTIINSIKTFEEFNKMVDLDLIKRIEESSKHLEKAKTQDTLQKKLRQKIQKIVKNESEEQFISYEDMLKSKKKKNQEGQNAILSELFTKIKQKQKKTILQIIKPWFITKNGTEESQKIRKKSLDQTSSSNLNKVKSQAQFRKFSEVSNETKSPKQDKIQREKDMCKELIISSFPHSIYFIENLYEKIQQMSSFYCKVNQDHFYFLLSSFKLITQNIQHNSKDQDLNIEFLFKMMQISQRVLLKKEISSNSKNQPIELLSHSYGKCSHKFNDMKFLCDLLSYFEKRKTKKKTKTIQPKGVFGFTKNFFAAVTGKKNDPVLNEEELFNCLSEMISLIANFSVPNEIILPFIKESLGNSPNQASYEYLKSIIINKKDVEERLSLFYRKQIKEKKEQKIKVAIENKSVAQYAFLIIASNGFFKKEDIELRLVCKELQNIHLQILANIEMTTQQKWVHLIPSKKMDYLLMKQQVAQNSVPSSIEEIITLDVNRSLHLHGESLNPTVLHTLLRTYAYYHKEISYCQGMNYIAGYLFIKTRNEEQTYRIFQHMMENRFKEIFINEFQVLKRKMYQFQRLLAIFHPQISDHFKRQMITPECYIVSWIITLFASSYQYTMQSYLIDFLWERFLIWGWKEFFRFILWIFSLFKEQLIELTYDKALHFLGEMGRSQMFLANYQKYQQKFVKCYGEPLEGIDRYQVSEELLLKFRTEYQLDGN